MRGARQGRCITCRPLRSLKDPVLCLRSFLASAQNPQISAAVLGVDVRLSELPKDRTTFSVPINQTLHSRLAHSTLHCDSPHGCATSGAASLRRPQLISAFPEKHQGLSQDKVQSQPHHIPASTIPLPHVFDKVSLTIFTCILAHFPGIEAQE
jgi:hypothetical protein